MTKHEEAAEVMARAALSALKRMPTPEQVAPSLKTICGVSTDAAFSALLKRYPGIAGVIEGTHISVPREPNAEIAAAFQHGMRREFGMTTTAGYHCRIYRAMPAVAEEQK
jgi:hypothetical protein